MRKARDRAALGCSHVAVLVSLSSALEAHWQALEAAQERAARPYAFALQL
jgi:hypothetical protein